MFHTPSKIQTRSVALRERQQQERAQELGRTQKEAAMLKFENAITRGVDNPGSIKSEPVPHIMHPQSNIKPAASCITKVSGGKDSRKSSASKEAKRKQFLLEAAKQKAIIKMDLINKTLEANLAALSDEEDPEEYSSQIDGDELPRSNVADWVEHQSNHIEHTEEQQAPEHGINTDVLRDPVPASTPASAPPAAAATAVPVHPALDSTLATLNNTVHLLAGALKEISTNSANNVPNASLLSRISTPKELPEFSGDQLEWLQFKQAFEESSTICNFSEKENLWRLRKCLKGAAKDAVSALFISATTPDKVMSTLELRFGNPDSIISRILQDINKLQPLPIDYHRDIVTFAVKVQNFVEAVKAVGREEYLQGTNIVSTILTKLPTVLIARWSDYSYILIKEGHKSRLVILSEFLCDEAVKISTTANVLTTTRQELQKSTRSHTVLLQTEESEPMCQFCKKSTHKLTDCKHFKKALRKTRWQYIKRNRLCFKCLLQKHERDTCKAPVCDKDGCGQAHHRLLHYNYTTSSCEREPAATAPSARAPNSATETGQTHRAPEVISVPETLTFINASDRVLLKVVSVRVHGPNGVVDSTALLDDGSSVSLMSASLAARAGLRGRPCRLRMRGAFGDNELVCDSTVVNVDLNGIGNKMHNIKMRCVDELNLPLQTLSILNCANYSHLKDIKDKLCSLDTKPELLIGQDNHHLLLPIEIKLGKVNEPSATLTPLGWCVHGRLCAARGPGLRPFKRRSAADAETNLFITDSEEVSVLREIQEEIRRSLVIDTLGVQCKPRQNVEEVRATALLEESATLEHGRWHVRLPWRDNRSLPDAYPTALTRMKGIERKMSKDLGFSKRYQERVSHLLDNDYARELIEPEACPRTWYLPHFGVDNPNKEKLRLVFDAACKVNGYSLNDYLLTGPDLLSSLFGIILRFRENPIAVTGDIRDMFLRIKIHAEDQNALRFLWRNSPAENLKTYVMTSLIFGANCSPFIAQFIKNKNALRLASKYPAAAIDAVCKSHYMDDYIDSVDDEATAIEMVRNVSQIHKSGGFEIRNWTSNSVAVLDSVPKETLGSAAVKFKVGQQHESERTLGMMWYPADDMLGFDLSLKRIPKCIINGDERPTKRLMLKVIMSIFDVLGFITPFTIQGRIMLQDTWRLHVTWDQHIPDNIHSKWRKWINLLTIINSIRIPRCYKTTNKPSAAASERDRAFTSTRASEVQDQPSSATSATILPVSSPLPAPAQVPPAATRASTQCATSAPFVAHVMDATVSKPSYNNLQLHLFCDASTKAMCTVAYWRWEDNNDIYVAFIASKCKVMPVKPLTMPRAELQAALLAARLASTIEKEHRLATERKYFWCDSTTVLHWIRNNARTYKAFEANRLGEIDELTRVSDWKYVPTKLNVADLATRETFDETMLDEWFTGPKFLYYDEPMWPSDVIRPNVSETSSECVAVLHEVPTTLPIPDPLRFSSWLRLLRATAMVLRFISKCKGQTGQVDCDTMERAERLLIRQAQSETFLDDLAAITNGRSLNRNSRLHCLSPFLDEHGLLRAGGRIDAAMDVSLDVKRPVILDGRHPVARLIVRHYHIKAAHGSQETVVNELRQRYWLLRLRPTVKSVVSRCMTCRIRKSKPQVPRMGELPKARVAHHQRPFSHCGLDLFGPMEVTVGRRREKRYGVLFTCLTVRAIHIELVSSLTSDSLIMALRRMAARRGWPLHLYSDNGTNLRGADTELQKSMKSLDTERLQNEGVNNGMKWTFIPPASPHWGGAWERLIRSVKTSLKVVLTERAPRDEVLNTFIAEVENIVNSRPLMHVSVEPGDVESLTPNHFLLGTSSNLPVMGDYDDNDLYLRKRWRTAQRLADMYWQRWVKEILPDLIPRSKWRDERASLKVGDLVLVVDPNSLRNTWPKGLVTGVFPGKDGRVRLVEVRTATGTLRRSASRVAPVLLSDECCDSTRVGNVGDALK